MKIKPPLWLRLLGIASAIAIMTHLVVNARDFTGSKPDGKAILQYLILCMLPAFLSIFTMLAQRYWISFIIGIWFLFLGFFISIDERASTEAAIFLLAAIVMCSIPFLNLVFGQKQDSNVSSEMNSEQDG